MKASFFKRIKCYEDTLDKIQGMKSLPSEKCYYQDDFHFTKMFKNTKLLVENLDTIDCALDMYKANFNPLVLNHADDSFPGGCVTLGSGAQEESIFRRSNYSSTLTLHFYPIRDSECVYSPNVTIFTPFNI